MLDKVQIGIGSTGGGVSLATNRLLSLSLSLSLSPCGSMSAQCGEQASSSPPPSLCTHIPGIAKFVRESWKGGTWQMKRPPYLSICVIKDQSIHGTTFEDCTAAAAYVIVLPPFPPGEKKKRRLLNLASRKTLGRGGNIHLRHHRSLVIQKVRHPKPNSW